MKTSAVLINVGRGASVDENALCDALNTGKIRGAALDVFRLNRYGNQFWMIDESKILMSFTGDLTITRFSHGRVRGELGTFRSERR